MRDESQDEGTLKLPETEEEWRERMDPETFRICRQKGTEPAFSGKYWDSKEEGSYLCAGCGDELFSSETKYDSGCGWPSFYQPGEASRITENVDHSHGMIRTEVVCSRCDSHLGHVFPDGPRDKTGLRYCINSASMAFRKKDEN